MESNEQPEQTNESSDSTESVDMTDQPQAKETKATKSRFSFFKNLSKRQKLLSLAVLVLLVLGIGGTLLLVDDDSASDNSTEEVTTQQQTQQLGASIALVEGQVQYSSDGGESWVDADGGETVSESDYIRTLTDSRGVLLLDDGSAVRLAPDSTVYISESTADTVSVVLESGQVYSRVVDDGSREYSVTTAAESFIARGTAYRVSTDAESDKLEVYQSQVEVSSEEQTVEEGNEYDTKTKQSSEIDLSKLADDEFVQWNKEQDQKDDQFASRLGVLDIEPEEEDEEPATPVPSASLTLNASARDNGIAFNWSLNNASAPNGFKLLRSKSATPTYGRDTSVYLSGASQRAYTLGLKDGATYNFRLCIYRPSANSCDTYSNSVRVTSPFNPPEAVKSGDVTLSIDGRNLNWTFNGTAPHGFKVLLGTKTNPTYPANSILFSSETSAKLPEKPADTYYVRVCKYTADGEIDGGCTDYSNQVEYVVTD